MCLKTLSIVFGLDVVSYMLVFFEKVDLFLTGKHRPNGEKNLDLIIKWNDRIFKFFASFQKTIGQIVIITGIFMKSVQHCIYLEVHFQIFENDPDDPFDLFCVGDCEKFPEDWYMIIGGGY